MRTQNVGFTTGNPAKGGDCGGDDNSDVFLTNYDDGHVIRKFGFSFRHTPKPKELVMMDINIIYDATKLDNSNESKFQFTIITMLYYDRLFLCHAFL